MNNPLYEMFKSQAHVATRSLVKFEDVQIPEMYQLILKNGISIDNTVLIAIFGGTMPEAGQSFNLPSVVLTSIGPQQFWLLGDSSDGFYFENLSAQLTDLAWLTNISGSRIFRRIVGQGTLDLLSKLVAIDFHPAHFAVGSFAQALCQRSQCLCGPPTPRCDDPCPPPRHTD